MTQPITPKQALFLWHLMLKDGASDVGVMSSDTVPRLSRAEWQTLVDADYLDSSPRGRATLLTATERTWSWAEQAEKVELAKLDSPAGAAALEALLNRLLPLLRERGIGLAELFKNDPPPAPPSPPTPRAPRKKAASKKGKAKKASVKKAKTRKAKTKKVKPAKAKKAKPAKAKKAKPAKAKPTKETRQSATRSTNHPLTAPPSLPERIEQACLKLTQGARQTRVKLYDLRASLWGVARDDLDSALLGLQREKKLVLYREDNSAALRTEDHEAAIFVGNEPRHLVLLEA